MTDQRKMERFQLPLTARISSAGEASEMERLYLVTADVCAGGAFFPTRSVLPEGTNVDVEMAFPLARFRSFKKSLHRVFIRIRGTVLRTTETGMAVQFKGSHRFSRRAA